jgi:hypothetical protein
MHEIVDREVAVSTDMHAKRRNIEGAINFGAGNNILADFGHIALVPVKGYSLVFLDQVSVFVCRRAQLFNEINCAGIIVIMAKLNAGPGRITAGLVQKKLEDFAIVMRWFLSDCHLPEVSCQVAQSVLVVFWKLIADEHQQIKIRIGLRAQAGQGDSFQ